MHNPVGCSEVSVVPVISGSGGAARAIVAGFQKEGADEIEETYKVSAPSEFPEAEQLLEVRVDETTLMKLDSSKNSIESENFSTNNFEISTISKLNLFT